MIKGRSARQLVISCCGMRTGRQYIMYKEWHGNASEGEVSDGRVIS